ncbi:MAG: PHP domain-containing protein [Candidatus Anstonellaceae archaeon]
MKVDFHIHTNYSFDSLSEPKQVVLEAEKKGLDAIAITDHDEIRGALEAKRHVEKLGLKLQVIVGEEVATDEGDLLVYFVKKRIEPAGLAEVLAQAKKQNAVCVAAHPYDFARSGIAVEKLEKDILKGIDGIEVFNARVSFAQINQKAFEFCLKSSKAQFAGSDAHHLSEIGKAYVEFEGVKRLDARAVLGAKRRIAGSLSPFFVHFYSRLAILRRNLNNFLAKRF